MMKDDPADSDFAPLIHWQFERDKRRLTCRIDARLEPSSYDVTTLPHWDVSSGAIETFDGPSEALRHHATIVARLRDAGWVVVSYTE